MVVPRITSRRASRERLVPAGRSGAQLAAEVGSEQPALAPSLYSHK